MQNKTKWKIKHKSTGCIPYTCSAHFANLLCISLARTIEVYKKIVQFHCIDSSFKGNLISSISKLMQSVRSDGEARLWEENAEYWAVYFSSVHPCCFQEKCQFSLNMSFPRVKKAGLLMYALHWLHFRTKSKEYWIELRSLTHSEYLTSSLGFLSRLAVQTVYTESYLNWECSFPPTNMYKCRYMCWTVYTFYMQFWTIDWNKN